MAAHICVPPNGTAMPHATPLQSFDPSFPLCTPVPLPCPPALQVKPHTPLVQVAVPPAGAGHTVPHVPQLLASLIGLEHAPGAPLMPGGQQQGDAALLTHASCVVNVLQLAGPEQWVVAGKRRVIPADVLIKRWPDTAAAPA